MGTSADFGWRTAHNSKAHQELHAVRRTIPDLTGRHGLQSFERALFIARLAKVHVCRGGALMTEPEGDDADIDAGLQEMHRRSVADGVRRN